MFESKRCRRCNKGLKKEWKFCPYCGESVDYRRPYGAISEDIEEEFERIDKMFGPRFFKFPRIDIESPFRRGGISIVIRGGTGEKPEVNVRTTGKYKKLEPQIKKKLRVGEEVEEIVGRKPPKITEEPETKIEKQGNVETIMIKLPDVKNLDDIDIRKLGQSIEIKAFAGDKAYFKLIPTKPNTRVSNKSFKKGILKIELLA